VAEDAGGRSTAGSRRPLTYADSGVDIAAGDDAVDRIRSVVASTARPEVLGGIGGFGGMFSFDPSRYRSPVLVSSTDGVGTKAMVAAAAGRYETIGIDLVAMCVDDIACSGAEPLFLLDYLVVGKLEPDLAAALVAGVAEGCRRAGCALLGGEMAEHPGAMEPGQFDLAGFAVGVVERDAILGPDRVRPGDVLIGLLSPGLRSNGYSLARRVLLEAPGLAFDRPVRPGSNRTLADELLEPSVIYAPGVLAAASSLHAAAHITGGGLPGNLVRALPPGCDAVVERHSWEVPAIFGDIARLGAIDEDEMLRVFNLGVGMVLVVPDEHAGRVLETVGEAGYRAAVIGAVVEGGGEVRFAGEGR